MASNVEVGRGGGKTKPHQHKRGTKWLAKCPVNRHVVPGKGGGGGGEGTVIYGLYRYVPL